MPRLALISAIVPLAVVAGLDPSGWYPFGPAKWTAVTVTLGLVAAATWWHAPVRVPRRPMLLWVALLGWLAIAAAFGADPWYAWIGTPERHLGVVGWVVFAAAFLAGSQLSTPADVRTLCRGVVVAALFCGGYSVVELVGGRPIALDITTQRLGGPFGSAAYLGAATCLLLPVAAGVALDRSWGPAWRSAALIASATCAVALVGSGARGAWVGIAVALAVAAPRLRRVGWRPIAAASVIAVGVLALVAPRLDDVVARSQPATSRVDEWALGVRTLGDVPILGAGPEGYRIEAVSHVDAAYERAYGSAVIADRAHDGPLDVALAGGIPAALLYVTLLAMVLAASWRVIRTADSTSAGIGIGVVAFVMAQLFLFPIAEIDPLLWLLAGVVWALDRSHRGDLRREPQLHRWSLGGVVAGSAFAAIALVAGSLDIAADRSAARALDDRDHAVDDARRATELRPDVVRYRLLLASARTFTVTLAAVDAAMADTDDALAISPRDPIVLTQRAGYLDLRADITGDPGDAQRALVSWQAIVDRRAQCEPCARALDRARERVDGT